MRVILNVRQHNKNMETNCLSIHSKMHLPKVGGVAITSFSHACIHKHIYTRNTCMPEHRQKKELDIQTEKKRKQINTMENMNYTKNKIRQLRNSTLNCKEHQLTSDKKLDFRSYIFIKILNHKRNDYETTYLNS